mgnify:CR=1 FL=1
MLFVVMAALLPAAVIIFATGAEHAAAMSALARAETLKQANAFAEIQTRVTESARQVMATLAAMPAFYGEDRRLMTELLAAANKSNPDYLNFTISDARGIVVASPLLEPGVDLSARPHVRAALDGGRFSAGEYVLGLVDDTPSFAYSYPLFYEDGRPRGSINALYKLASYAELFEGFALPDDSFLGLVDRNGIRLYFYPPKPTNPVGWPIKASVWEGISKGAESGIIGDEASDGSKRYFGYKKLYLEPGAAPYMAVVYATPQDAPAALSRRITLRNLLLLGAAAAVALIITGGLSGALVSARLDRIAAMADELRSGELSARLGFGDERSDLGRIAAALDAMAQSIQERDRRLIEDAERLSSSLREKEVLLREVHHRVKNNLQVILSLIRLQDSAHPGSGLARRELEERIAAMSLVHEMLYKGESLEYVELGSYCEQLVNLIKAFRGDSGALRLAFEADYLSLRLEKAIPFGLLVNELVGNAYKHAAKDGKPGTVALKLKRLGNGEAELTVRDDGPGLPEGFDPAATGGLGLQLAQALADQLDGRLSWRNDGGAAFSLVFGVDG